MSKIKEIPTFSSFELEENFYKGDVPFSSFTTKAHHIFHINRIEDYNRLVSFPLQSDLQPHRLTVFSIFFLTKGTSTRGKGLDTFHFGENTFFFVPAYQITTHEFMSAEVEGFYCHFSLELLTSDFKLKDLLNDFPFLEFSSHPLVTINYDAKMLVIPLFERLMNEYRADNNCRYDILRAYLVALFTEIKPFVESSKSITTNAASILTEEFKKLLSEYIYQKQKITDYAELLSVSPNHLNKCVKKTMGKSAHDLLNEMLLLEAKVLLKQTNLTISEISYKIGKNEISDFARFFKAQTGMKPSEYRNLV